MTEQPRKSVRQRLAHVRAGTRLVVGLVASVLTALLLPQDLSREIRAVASWDGFAIVSLASTWFTILTVEPEQIGMLARREDPSRIASMVLVLLGASASILAVVVLLQSSTKLLGQEKIEVIVLALSAVALGWFLIHTVFTLRYAHVYYDAPDGQKQLEFPGNDSMPDYLDFAYFAFVVGMTAQTSDVCVSGRPMRRAALLHGIVSYVFNTAVVALSIGVLTTLL